MNDISSNLYIIKNFSDNVQADKLTKNVINTFSSPSSKIAVDWLSKNIYHLDPSYNWITVQPIKGVGGSNRKTVVDGLLSPKSIAVDPLNGDIVVDETERRIFWLDIGRETLETCGYDGSDRRVLKRSPSLLMSMSGLTLYQNIVCVTIQFAYLVECINKQTGQTVWQHLFQWPKDGKFEYKVPQALRFIKDKDQGNETRLCVDWLNNNIYWAERKTGLIMFINERFPMEMPVFQNIDHPSALAINPLNRLWWVDIDGVYSMDLETNEIQLYTSYNIISFTKYKDYLLLLKNQGEVRITNINSPGIHRHLDVPYLFTNAIVYDQSEQPIAKVPLQSDFVLTVDFTHATIFQVSMADANIVAIDVNETIRPVNAIFHPPNRNLIYSDAMYREIRQLSMSGRESVALTNTGLFEPQALVMDPSTGHLIYSAVSTKSYIGILNIETRERKTVVPGLTSVYNIAIHPQKGYLFWSDLVYSASYIGRSYMDGSAMINLIYKDISQPNSLTLDYKNNFLYWTDGDLGTINYCDLDGKNRGILLQDRKQKFRHFDISGDHIYYTALDDQKITKASLSNAKEIAWMNYSAEFGKLQSLQVYGEEVIPVHSVCSVSNGRCSTFCLPTAKGRKCACPDGVDLQKDKRTCEGVVKCPEVIPNGKVNPDCAPYIGIKCTYTCNSGFRPTMSAILCQGTWNISSLDQLCVEVPTQRPMTDPTNDGAIAGGIVAASLAVTIVLVLIIIFLCRRASDSPAPDSGAIHYINGGHVNRNGVNGTRKGSRVIIEEVPSNNHSNT
ncbi:low-density lipoprotein receptor-related protein 4-like [Saccostrea echinata]|uniref:low-density lipoprotein receptor-related protein 4-like n=1 Tax=Saccostrea echinata TaxID=191078 RepID=UPI002A80AB09|nr:low-density lipoprotein receptor-related protein 4-like [Saccostrea echinata]